MNAAALRRLPWGRVIIFSSFGLLALVAIYCAWYANYYMSGNSDDIVYPYLFAHFKPHDIVLPSQHSNILKFPLFILLALIPYTFTTFTITNIGLVLITVLGWALLLTWIFGKRYAPLTCLIFISILLGSQLLNTNLLGTTIRNIEYPIALAFIIYLAKSLLVKNVARIWAVIGAILGLLYAMTIAGDSFFLYTTTVSVLAALVFFRYSSSFDVKHKPQFNIVMGYFIGCNILAIIIRESVKVFGIARYYTDTAFLPHILPLSHLGPSISVASTQLLDLFDANIFGKAIRPGNSLVFLNFLLLCACLTGVFIILLDVLKTTQRKTLLARVNLPRVFTLGVLGIDALVTFGVYIASDLAVVQNPSGSISTAHQERYLTILPFVLSVGAIYFIFHHERYKKIFFAFPLLIAFVTLINVPTIIKAHFYDAGLRSGPIAVAKAVQEEHIPLLISGYWYGSSARFWSNNRLAFASVANCNIPSPPINNRLSWYKASPKVNRSALLVDRNGIDAPSALCADSHLKNIFGNPVKVIRVNAPSQPYLWLYNYDIRTRLKSAIF